MKQPAHKTYRVNRTQTVRFYPFVFTGEVPCKEVRTPLNSITFSEQRNEETGYGYCDDYQPHAVKRMFDYKNEMLYDMRWDEAGNLGQVSMGKPGEMFEKGRFLFWTEDCCGCEHRLCQSNVVSNRMHAAVDEKYFSYYVYDHSGGSCASREQSQACLSYAEMEQRRRSQRRLKLTGINKQQDVCQRLRTPQNKLNEVSNADLMATYTILDNPTLYPSPYMVLNNKGYTNVTEVESRASSLALPRCSNVTERKHYYAGTDLCGSRAQSQTCLSYAETKQSVRSNRVAARLGSGGLDALQSVIANDEDLQWKADQLFKQSLDQVNHRVLGENDLNCIMRNKFSPEVLGEWIEGIPYHVQAEVAVDNWQFKDMIHSMLDDPNNGHEKEVFFYHSDHLGSASWITDGGGMAVQHIQYLPYGEPYVNQHPFGYSERFTFTGKERDEETGYGYFGARYMDYSMMTMWLSVDPMADKYPSISPYAYCVWNPIKLVDPDGRRWKNSSDSSAANDMRDNVQRRINDIESSIRSCQQAREKRIANRRSVVNQDYDLSELENQKKLLTDFLDGLDQLEQSEITFTFCPISSDFPINSGFMPQDVVYSIKYQINNEGNMLHETKHAIQIYRAEYLDGEIMTAGEMETDAYSTQYSFNPNSILKLYNDSGITPSSRIPLEWVRGLYFIKNAKREYPYGKIK